ncbi:hypothetical protein MYCTH_61415 [Thermothelomyces thermophilus ATCC 42464]|uniref:Transposase Tc1-like domain-containing protein n=1 Tax=Thermothelomyces thermophilus (strain ATCC 42464 / BCRC 31852 / DSM 1799) TaxID=573729 RepID=G2QMI8_THET4|nr:uncharacterized protein MYCTH_61415 [Thermothelomyces thermophilus ATCC 42464]AEO61168.1 hypothetical protein MYCTH_61415 [Thermothelomyces thermophilus ATCC 42464]
MPRESEVPAMPEMPAVTEVPPGKGKCTTVVQRTQALTLHSMGVKTSEIEAKTGVKKEALKSLLRRAKARGYIPGGPIKEEHVANAPKSGRPKVITESVTQVIEQLVTKNSTRRQYSCQQIADTVADQLGGTRPSRETIRRSIRRWRYMHVHKSI